MFLTISVGDYRLPFPPRFDLPREEEDEEEDAASGTEGTVITCPSCISELPSTF